MGSRAETFGGVTSISVSIQKNQILDKIVVEK